MSAYFDNVAATFKTNTDSQRASKQKAYLRDQFEFFGLTSPIRKELQKKYLTKNSLPNKQALKDTILEIWKRPEREFQYFGMELAFKFKRQFAKDDLALFELMITSKSWWDTVDFIASNVVGEYFKLYPEEIRPSIDRWLNSDNLWLQRTTLLFQLKYKDKVDTQLLEHCINELNGTKEFFINKAIGWALREYSKVNPEWVKTFVATNPLSKLSEKEGLRLIKF